jgi:hypothetical protein
MRRPPAKTLKLAAIFALNVVLALAIAGVIWATWAPAIYDQTPQKTEQAKRSRMPS